MKEVMNFPDTFEEFIKNYEFKDKKEVYTNGAQLIPVFRVLQGWKHYINKNKKNLDKNSSIYTIIFDDSTNQWYPIKYMDLSTINSIIFTEEKEAIECANRLNHFEEI